MRLDAPIPGQPDAMPTPTREHLPVYRLSGLQRQLAALAGWGVRGYYQSLELSMPEGERRALQAVEGPRLIVVWHNRSLIAPHIFQRYLEPERLHCLISPSRRAAWQVAFFEDCGLQVVRGSSSRRGSEALTAMVKVLRSGQDVGLAPDGPKGPPYTVGRSVCLLARHTGATCVLLTMNARRARRLKTWDAHLLPLPGSTVHVRVDVIPERVYTAWTDAALCTAIAQRLSALTVDEAPLERPHLQPSNATDANPS